jgi:hypothetical protein
MALRLLTSALAQRQLTVAEAIAIVEYHLRRNQTALRSHTKSWHNRHNNIRYKVML